MFINYKPHSHLETFGLRVFNILVKKYPKTFFTGGMVRDLLLKRKVTDIDMATEARPEQIMGLLAKQGIGYRGENQKFGNVTAVEGELKIEITTFRKDKKAISRYPKVNFITDPKVDSQRRDFTINALYLNPGSEKILDFHDALSDIKKHQLKFIGDPITKIEENPLRIIRGLRFALALNLKFEAKTKLAIKEKFKQVDKLTVSKVDKEIFKVKNRQEQKLLRQIIQNPKLFDKYFK